MAGRQFVLREEICNRVRATFGEDGIPFARRDVRPAIPGLEDASALSDAQKQTAAAATPATIAERRPSGKRPFLVSLCNQFFIGGRGPCDRESALSGARSCSQTGKHTPSPRQIVRQTVAKMSCKYLEIHALIAEKLNSCRKSTVSEQLCVAGASP